MLQDIEGIVDFNDNFPVREGHVQDVRSRRSSSPWATWNGPPARPAMDRRVHRLGRQHGKCLKAGWRDRRCRPTVEDFHAALEAVRERSAGVGALRVSQTPQTMASIVVGTISSGCAHSAVTSSNPMAPR